MSFEILKQKLAGSWVFLASNNGDKTKIFGQSHCLCLYAWRRATAVGNERRKFFGGKQEIILDGRDF